MENQYQTITSDFYFRQNPYIYIPTAETTHHHAFVPQDLFPKPSFNFETAFFHLQQKYAQLRLQNQELKNQLQNINDKHQNSISLKRKFIRRKEDDLDKKYGCCYQNCKKHYASELALNLHIKNKHKGGTKKQREDLAKQIIKAETEGKPAPTQLFRLPDGFLQQFRREHHLKKDKDIKSNS